jgi:hypothetical protein
MSPPRESRHVSNNHQLPHYRDHHSTIQPYQGIHTFAMATIRPMCPNDLLRISATNLDHLTETYNIGFYLEYLTKWPELCQVVEGFDGEIEGYSTQARQDLSSVPQSRNYKILTPSPPSPRQTRILALRPANNPLRALDNWHKIPKLSSLARPHHRPHRCAFRTASRPRDRPVQRAGTLLGCGECVVCGFVCAGE